MKVPAAAALLDTDVAVLPFWALSEMPFTKRTIAMLYSRRVRSSDAPPLSVLCWSLNTRMKLRLYLETVSQDTLM